MPNKPCISTIKKRYPILTKAERKVADFILENSDAVVSMSIAELAEGAETAQSAVVRCCQSIGFSGFSELKIALAMEVSKNKQLNYTPYIAEEDTASNILDKVFSANIKTLHDTAEKIDRERLEHAVDLLDGANSIYIYAVGTSAGLANDFQYRLMQQGCRVFCFTDVAAMKVSTLNIQKGDVAVGISHSGRTVPTVEALELARKNGATTVCITSYAGSNITRISDCAIEVYTDEIHYPVEAISARIAHIGVMDALTVALSAKHFKDATERSKITHELVNSIRYKETKYQ